MPDSFVLTKDLVASACLKFGVCAVDGGEDGGRGYVILPCTHALEALINGVASLLPPEVRGRAVAAASTCNGTPDGWSFDLLVEEDDGLILTYVYVDIPVLSDLEAVVLASGRMSPPSSSIN